MDRTFCTMILLLLLVLGATTSPAEETTPHGVLGLTPVGAAICVVVEIPLGPAQALTGLRWYHNDEDVVFPRVTLVETGDPEDLGSVAPRMTWTDVTGPSLGWGRLTLEEPLQTAGGVVLAVFQLPPYQEKVGEGRGGGPAFGYLQEPGDRRVWFGEAGEAWYPLSSRRKLAFAAEVVETGVALSPGTSQAAKTATPPAEETPRSYATALEAPRPNPSNPSTEIHFSLGQEGLVQLRIYNQRGEKVWEIPEQVRPAGPHVVHWRGEDGAGRPVASGVYFLRMQADGQTFRRRITLVR